MQTRIYSFLAVCLVAMTACGCTTLSQRRNPGRGESVISDPPATQSELNRLKGRQDEAEAEIKHLRSELEQLRQDSNKINQEQQVRMESVERSAQAASAAWAEDKKEIVRLIKVAAGSGATAGAAPAGPRMVERGYEHVVKTGETLSKIARAYNVPLDKILAANKLKDDRIFVGQKLFIPE